MNTHYSKDDILQVKQLWLHDNLEESTKTNKGGRHYHGKDHYICPLCRHGEVYNPMWEKGSFHCYQCDFSGSGFDVEAKRRGLAFGDALRAVMREYGYGGDSQSVHRTTAKPIAKQEQAKNHEANRCNDALTWNVRCKSYLLECAARFAGSPVHEYAEKRGLLFETCKRLRYGYDHDAFSNHRTLGGSLSDGVPALILPYSPTLTYYGGRLLKPIGDTKYMKPLAEIAGSEPLMNSAALYAADVVIVVEGWADLATVIQVANCNGLNVGAVGLNGTGCAKLIDALKKRPTKAKIAIALDNDRAGHAGAIKAAKGLETLGASYGVWVSGYGTEKDLNDLLKTDAAAAAGCICDIVRDAAEGYLLDAAAVDEAAECWDTFDM